MTYIDYRLKENRWEGFLNYYHTGMLMDEVDPAKPMLEFIAKEKGLDTEGRLYLAWLYSCCYSAPTAYVMITLFPDPLQSQESVDRFWTENKKRFVFETDRLRVKTQNQFPKMYASYRAFQESTTPASALGSYSAYLKGDPYDTYDNIYDNLKLYYFSRYSMFMYLESIYNLTHFPMQPTTLELREALSSRNGLCYALGLDDWCDRNLSPKQWDYLQRQLKILHDTCKKRFSDIPVHYWNIETALCAYKKLFRNTRYTGYYIDRQQEEVQKSININPDIDLTPLTEFRKSYFHPETCGEVAGHSGIRSELLTYFTDTGNLATGFYPSKGRGW